MQIKYVVKNLVHGMYVSELDRPWNETLFLFQGFMIKSEDDLAALRKTCKFVYVDDLKSSADSAIQARLHAVLPRRGPAEVQPQGLQSVQRLRTAINKLEVDAARVIGYLKSLVQASAIRRGPSSEDIRAVVNRLIDDIAMNPHASAWLRLLGGQDKDDSRNGINTAILAMEFARHIGWDEEMKRVVGQGAIFHDIGLTRVSQEIRRKAGPLTKLERRIIEHHPSYGAHLLECVGGMDERVIKIVKQHHEYLDGSGYPEHLSSGAIAIYVQLVSLCDLYDACTTRYPRNGALLPCIKSDNFLEWAGILFDTELAEQFVRYIGIYPLGTLVKLYNGILAVVVATDEAHRLRPTVLLIRDADGSPILPPRTLSIEVAERIGKYREWCVEEVKDPELERVDVTAILRRELMGAQIPDSRPTGAHVAH